MVLQVTHASTVFARSSSPVLSYLKGLRSKASSNLLLFALSANAPDLSTLAQELNGLCVQSVGCLSGPIPHLDTASPNSRASREGGPMFSCSVALLPLSNCTTFRSTISGQKKISIGRSRTVEKKSKPEDADEDYSDELISRELETGVKSTRTSETTGLEGSHHPWSAHRSIIHFSDDAHQGFSKALQDICPKAVKVGIHERFPHNLSYVSIRLLWFSSA